ncbi:MAG: PIN domain-containing protein [Bacilli bacterium]|nr:PIN domain-containing protein [Bacilli bacterium]
MKVLFDTNVLIDAITCRDDFKNQKKLMRYVANETIEGYISSKQITDIYYILRKYVSSETEKRRILRIIMEQFETLPCLKSVCEYCLRSNIEDYEDAVIDETAKIFNVGYIVTNNIDDFKNSKQIIITPRELVILLEAMNQ